MANFEWEDRYLVLKRKVINDLPIEKQAKFWALIDEAIDLLPALEGKPREYLVLESDWPEYPVAKAAIQARCDHADVHQ